MVTRLGAAALALCVLLTGCNYTKPGPGEVTGKKIAVVNAVKYWHLFVRQDDGTRRDYLAKRSQYAACQVGERWPDCTEGGAR